jgi:hypothetical protein
VRRSRTNTPLQALALLNDEDYVDAARALADRMRSLGATTEERLEAGFRLVLARKPTAGELDLLAAGWRRKREHFVAKPEEAGSLLQVNANDDGAIDRAAYAAMASVLLNLDEAITRE